MDPVSAIGGILGGIGGSQKDVSTKSINLNPASDYQNWLQNATRNNTNDLNSLVVNNGPGAQAVTNANNATNQYAQMLQDAAKNGGMPNQSQIDMGNDMASKLFAPQQTALQQSFVTQTQQSNQQAAALGRSVNDPILQAKLRTGMMNQQAVLNGQQGAQGAQIAMALPQQQLAYMGQGVGQLQGLASQAFQNRAFMLGNLNNMFQGQQQFQLGSSGATMTSGGGLGGAMSGAIGGMGSGAYANAQYANAGKSGGGMSWSGLFG